MLELKFHTSLKISSLSLSFHFPGGPGLAGTRIPLFWILLELRMMVVVTAAVGAIRRAKLQPKCHHQETNTQFFYRPDAVPVAQPTVSKHWRKSLQISSSNNNSNTPSCHIWNMLHKIQRNDISQPLKHLKVNDNTITDIKQIANKTTQKQTN